MSDYYRNVLCLPEYQIKTSEDGLKLLKNLFYTNGYNDVVNHIKEPVKEYDEAIEYAYKNLDVFNVQALFKNMYMRGYPFCDILTLVVNVLKFHKNNHDLSIDVFKMVTDLLDFVDNNSKQKDTTAIYHALIAYSIPQSFESVNEKIYYALPRRSKLSLMKIRHRLIKASKRK